MGEVSIALSVRQKEAGGCPIREWAAHNTEAERISANRTSGRDCREPTRPIAHSAGGAVTDIRLADA